MALPRMAACVLALALLSGCARLPWQSAEDAFTRCMADSGIEVTDVRIEINEDGSMLEFSEDVPQEQHRLLRSESDLCWERVQAAYGR